MQRANTEVFREALAAFNRRDKTAFLALCDPDIENFAPREWPESDPVQGSEAVWDFFVENNEPWENSPLEPVEVLAAGEDTVVAHLQGQMRGRVSGASVRWAFWQVAVYRAGRVVRISWFGDRAEAFEVAGLEA